MKLKRKIKYLNYNNDKLVTMLLDQNSDNSSQSKINYSKRMKMDDYDNYLQKKVYELTIKKDHLYEWLLENKIFYEKDKNIIKKIPKDLLLKSSFVKDVLNRYRISIVKRIKRVFAREGIEMVGASENDIFITNVTDELLSKIKNKINHQYQDIFLIRDIDKFLKNKSSILYKVNDKVKGINEYHYSKLIMPKNHKWKKRK